MADVSVRPARPEDAERVAAVQQDTWRQAYAGLLPAAVLELPHERAAAVWLAAVERPPTDRHRLLVAMEGAELVGFAASGPDEEVPDAAELVSLLVLPRWGRRGHGSRLLAASVASWQQDGFRLATAWAFERDVATPPFLRGAGWEPDGATRGLDTGRAGAGAAALPRRRHGLRESLRPARSCRTRVPQLALSSNTRSIRTRRSAPWRWQRWSTSRSPTCSPRSTPSAGPRRPSGWRRSGWPCWPTRAPSCRASSCASSAPIEPAAHGARNRADLLADTAGVPVRRARRDAALAARLAAVPGLADVVAEGGLELDAALLLVRAWLALPVRLRDDDLAAALVTLGQLVDHAELSAKVEELLGALAPDVTDRDLADARDAAHLTLRDVGARTVLAGECDRLTGELVRQVLHAAAEADRGLAPEQGGTDDRTGPRRAMDALVACLQAAAQTPAVPGEPQLVVVATVDDLERVAEVRPDRPAPDDVLADLFDGLPVAAAGTAGGAGDRPGAPRRPRWGARSRGGVPVGPRILAALTCQASLTRLVLGPLGHPLDSSPNARQLSRRGRRALEHRAGYRCQRTGCGRPAFACVPHHVVPFALGGPSTQANTVLLCPSCHHRLHDRQQPLLLTDGSRIGPRGWLDDRPPGAPPAR